MKPVLAWAQSALWSLAFAIAAGAIPALGAPISQAPPEPNVVRIAAVVNGMPITSEDVDNRTRLFVLSSAMPADKALIERLKPQILRQLIDERVRMQAVEKNRIVVQDKQIAAAIKEIEQRNSLQQGGLRTRLEADSVSYITLVDQIRTEIGWTLLMRERLGDRLKISPADVAARQRLDVQERGKPVYHLREIFIPIDDASPAAAADAQRFAETVIKELRAGAAFPVVAAQFSQSQTALSGGDAGWVQLNQLDPQVAQVVQAMPAGAVSNPIKVPGGVAIDMLVAKHDFGSDMATVLTVRQTFLPFSSPLNAAAPTPAQLATLDKAKAISARVKSCAEMEQVARENGSIRPSDPGPIRLDNVQPAQFRQILATQPVGRASQPLVAPDGIAVMVVCSREDRNLAEMTKENIERQILDQRVELLSRQLLQDLRRQAMIEVRSTTSLSLTPAPVG